MEPVEVKVAIASASIVEATWRAAAAMASEEVWRGSGRAPSVMARQPGSASVRATMRSIMFTASNGYWPAAVSAESITASAPSNTAVATSDASARVGVGEEIMLSSICVATMTGRPRARAARTMRFWMSGTSSGGHSTPRSPRATITASARSRMASICSTAWGFSIFTSTQARPAAISFASATSSGRWTKDRPMKSIPRGRTNSRSARSFAVSAGMARGTSGTFTPLRSESAPPTRTSVSR